MTYYTDMTFACPLQVMNTGPIEKVDIKFTQTATLTRTAYLPITLNYPLMYIWNWSCKYTIGRVVQL